MPRHQQITTCRKSGGPVSKHCNCEHCCLAVCTVCGGAEGSLTTDCPGARVDHDRQQEIYETNLDFTDTRGWHLSELKRSPRFEDTSLPPEPLRVDPRKVVAPTIDWVAVDRTVNLQHELTLKAITWVLADRISEDHSAAILRLEDEAAPLRGKTDLDVHACELLAKLERANIDFRLADRRSQKCDDEFRQAARGVVAALEEGPRFDRARSTEEEP